MADVLTDFCKQLATTPVVTIPRIRLPLGIFVQAPPRFGKLSETECDLIDDLLAQLAPMIAALRPLFTVIAILAELMNCLASLPHSIGAKAFKLNKFLSCMARLFPKLLQALQDLASLIPVLAVPGLIVDILNAILTALNCILTQLASIESLLNTITNTLANPENARQALLAQCSADNLGTELDHLIVAISAIVMILCIVASLFRLIGQDSLADQIAGQNFLFASETNDLATKVREFKDFVLALRDFIASILGAFSPAGTQAERFVDGFAAPDPGSGPPYGAGALAGGGAIDTPWVDGGATWRAKAAGGAGNNICIRMTLSTGVPAAFGSPTSPPSVSVVTTGITPEEPEDPEVPCLTAVVVTIPTICGDALCTAPILSNSTGNQLKDAVAAHPVASELIEIEVEGAEDDPLRGEGRIGETITPNTDVDSQPVVTFFENLRGGADAPSTQIGLGASFDCGG